MNHAGIYVKTADGGFALVDWIGSGPQRVLVEHTGAEPITLWTGEVLEPGQRTTVGQHLTAHTPPASKPDQAPGRRPRLDVFEEPGQ
jgi:hypothetical protein